MRKYLSELVELNGIAGKEDKVREYIKSKIENKVDSIKEDVVGNLIAFKKGKDSSKSIMVSSHMDEVGYMVTKINEDGTISMVQSGGVDPRVTKAQRLKINGEIPAIVNSTPIHLDHDTTAVKGYDSIKVFAGFTSKDDAKAKVKIGDMVTFDVKYYESEGHALCKAFDDRVGCSVQMDIIDYLHENNERPLYDTYFCFVVQEEVGLRGSGVAAKQIKPDAALILEGTTAGDNPELRPEIWATHIGNGPVITFAHSGLILDKKIYDEVLETARKMEIKYQYKMRIAGGTDAARISKTMYGIPCGVISVSCRYLHSANTIINLDDYKYTYELARKLIHEGRIIK